MLATRNPLLSTETAMRTSPPSPANLYDRLAPLYYLI